MLFSLRADNDPREVLQSLATSVNGESCVLGLGESLLKSPGAEIKGMHAFSAYSGPGFDVPSTPAALWV